MALCWFDIIGVPMLSALRLSVIIHESSQTLWPLFAIIPSAAALPDIGLHGLAPDKCAAAIMG